MSELRCFNVGSGEEVMAVLTRHIAEAGIVNGAIVSMIGAVASARISNMPADDASSDELTDYEQPLELSGTGEIVDGEVHVHVVLSGEGDSAIAGHLHEATVDTWYVAAYVIAS